MHPRTSKSLKNQFQTTIYSRNGLFDSVKISIMMYCIRYMASLTEF